MRTQRYARVLHGGLHANCCFSVTSRPFGCSITDVLVTDASSVANELVLCVRPIVFLDVPELLAAAEDDPRLDLKTWGRKAGETVRAPQQAWGRSSGR